MLRESIRGIVVEERLNESRGDFDILARRDRLAPFDRIFRNSDISPMTLEVRPVARGMHKHADT